MEPSEDRKVQTQLPANLHAAVCREVTVQSSADVENPELNRSEGEAAMWHNHAGPSRNYQAGHLIRALATNEEDRLTCGECRERLPDYLAAKEEGQADGSEWSFVVLHLETCPACAAEYAQLLDLADLAAGKRGADPVNYPAPQLAFLHTPKQ